MCVIIYIPKDSTISKDELREAWNTNPDGAGYAVQLKHHGKDMIKFHRGFMKFDTYYKHIKQYINNNNLLLHFRISTSDAVNQHQTHPYKKGNTNKLYGFTIQPVIAMNGVISQQICYSGCNDTESFIIDNKEAFAVVNQSILDIIQEATGSRWAVMLPDKVILSSDFKEYDGRYYSNKNHLWSNYGYFSKQTGNNYKVKDLIKGKLYKQLVVKDKDLYFDVEDYIEFNCNSKYYNNCKLCKECLKDCKDLEDIETKIWYDTVYTGGYY